MKTFGITIDKVQYMDTRNGMAYTGVLLMDGEKAGMIENEGRGGVTQIYYNSADIRNKLHERMIKYFDSIGLNTVGVDTYSAEYTFAEHLLDIHEAGQLRKNRKLKFLR